LRGVPREPSIERIARKLGGRIRAMRVAANVTQEGLAWECELSKGYLSLIETGKRLPSVLVLLKLARTLRVDVRRFFDP
jgi:transcriptional regulator with XRE-family HTH domain